jgi:hypothetical protein
LLAALNFAAHSQDDVKKMNQMMLYAKVVTIRDAQLNEKKVRSPGEPFPHAVGSSIT